VILIETSTHTIPSAALSDGPKSDGIHQSDYISRYCLADDRLNTSYLVFFPSALDDFTLFRNGHSAQGVVYLLRVRAVVVVINELLAARHGTSGTDLGITIKQPQNVAQAL